MGAADDLGDSRTVFFGITTFRIINLRRFGRCVASIFSKLGQPGHLRSRNAAAGTSDWGGTWKVGRTWFVAEPVCLLLQVSTVHRPFRFFGRVIDKTVINRLQ